MKVKVRWERQILLDLDLNIEDPPSVFKSSLHKVTGIPPGRQNLMLMGALVKDSWKNLPVEPNCVLLLLANKEQRPPKNLVQDDKKKSLTKRASAPPGLVNLGNTCYLNATLQCLRTIPELVMALKNLKGEFIWNEASKENLVIALRDQFELMEKGLSPTPYSVLNSLHSLMPQFSERGWAGKWKQQDANEFWIVIINIISDALSVLTPNHNVVKQYLSGMYDVKFICTESDEEPSEPNEELFFQVSCFISPHTKTLNLGLESNLTEKISKHSSVLSRDANFEKICRIKRLPAYLTVQLLRTSFNEKENVSLKLMKEVKFPVDFDAFELCTPELKEKLRLTRERLSDRVGQTSGDSSNSSDEEDVGSSKTGYFRLRAVLTHKGPSTSCGHYVACISHSGKWWVCDDSDVYSVSEDAVLKLSGGYSSAYILLYGPK